MNVVDVVIFPGGAPSCTGPEGHVCDTDPAGRDWTTGIHTSPRGFAASDS